MTSKYFAEKLRAIQVDTPLTTKFENELDDNGKRKYAQLNNRWWDNSTGTQKEHLICWFSRKYYTDGSITADAVKTAILKKIINIRTSHKLWMQKLFLII